MAKDINFFEKEMEISFQVDKTEPTAQKEMPKKATIPRNMRPLVPEQQPPEIASRTRLKRIIEALLFVSHEPIHINKIREVLDTVEPLKPRQLQDLLQELSEEFILQQRAFRLEEIAEGYVLRTCKEYGPYIDLLLRNKRTEKLSPAAAEVLAIIAYRNPITRPQIDAIRGVDSSGIIQNLLERQLIESVGKVEAPGRPTLYGITPYFLKHFGLRDLKDLPGWQALDDEKMQKS